VLHPNYGWNHSKQMKDPPPTHGPPCLVVGDKEKVGSLELPTLFPMAITPHCCCWFLWLPKKERGRTKERKKKIYICKKNKTMMNPWIKTMPSFKVVFLFCFHTLSLLLGVLLTTFPFFLSTCRISNPHWGSTPLGITPFTLRFTLAFPQPHLQLCSLENTSTICTWQATRLVSSNT